MAFERTLSELQERGDFNGVIAECDHLLNARLASVKKAVVLRYKGVALAQLSEDNLHLAIAAFREGLPLSKGNPDLEGPLLACLIAAYSLVGNYAQCEGYVAALERLTEAHLPSRNAFPRSLYNLAYAYDRSEHLQEAATTYQRALALCHGQPLEARIANNLADVLIRLRRLDEAGHVLSIVNQHKNTGFEAQTLDCEAAYHLANYDLAAATAKSSAALSHPTCDLAAKGLITYTKARIALAKGDTKKAHELGLQAISIGQRIPSSLIVDRAARFLQSLESSRGVI